MAYISTVDNGTTIVVTTGAETATFTIATANAVLLESTPIRAVIKETYYIWYVYDLRMIRYRHDTGATTTGMALTTGHGGPYNIISEHDWYAMTAAEATANAARTTQLQDVTMAAPGTGDEVDDLVWSLQLADGFGADRARHFDHASNVVAYTADATRVGHVDVIHDPMITVNGTDDLVVGHWKMDDNTTGTTVVDSKGNSNGTFAGETNTSDVSSVDSIRGRCFDFDGVNDRVSFNGIISSLTDTGKFTFSFYFKPGFSYSDVDTARVFGYGAGSNDGIELRYREDSDLWTVWNDIGNANQFISFPAYTSDEEFQQWHYFVLSVDLNEGIIYASLNNDIVVTYVSDTFTATPTLIWFGRGMGTNWFDGFIDDIKLIDGCLLPYGAYYTGNGSVDATAHEEITFFWTDSDTTPIGSNVTSNGDYTQAGPIGNDGFRNDAAGEYATAVTSGNISAAEGSLSFWFKPNSALGADCTLFYADTAFKVWWDDSDNDVVFTYNTDVLNMGTAFAAGDTNWHHIRVMWDASTALYIIVDGVETSLLTGVDAAPTLDTNMYFTADDASGTNRADVIISDVYITNKLYTPQIPVVLGSGPIYAPRVTVE